MNHSSLQDYRCQCGKLLFRGELLASIVEIKCKRCGSVRMYGVRDPAHASVTFSLVVDEHGIILTMCRSARLLGHEQAQYAGRQLGDIFPSLRGTEPGRVPQYLPEGLCVVKDSKPVPAEIYIAPLTASHDSSGRYRVFTVCHQ